MNYFSIEYKDTDKGRLKDSTPEGTVLSLDIPSPGLGMGHMPEQPSYGQPQQWSGISPEYIADIVSRSLSALRVYVVEADITDSQNNVRATVEQSTF